MQANLKWLLLPPAIGLVLFLGPLQGGGKTAVEPTPEATTEVPAGRTNVPTMPSAWQISSTLVGVLLLGFIGIVLVKRVRHARPVGDGEYVVLRQSVRLTPKQAVHVVEFDGDVLLIGESDGNLNVLQAGGATRDAMRDEAEVQSRTHADEDLERGAEPRDLVIPRPAAAARPQTRQANPHVAAKLANFKNLLQRVGAGSAT